MPGLFGNERLNLCLWRQGIGAFIQFMHGDGQVHVRMNHLHRLLILLPERGAQALMTGNQRIETTFERRDVKLALQVHGTGDVVGGAVGVHLPEEPLALLSKRQRHRIELRLGFGNRQVRR
ncbi:hypothetical protein TMM008_42660 [Pseudomonas sp. 008]|nr:hypothetical protein TMM008_42660 [Pseudomonas sp. 008]